MSDTENNPAPEVEQEPVAESGANESTKEERQWAMFLHLSLLAGFIIPLGGLLVPIIIWQMKKEEMPSIVPHAHVVLNWIITALVYSVICFILMFIVIGIFGFIALSIATVAFAIIGGIKANEGEVWVYPATIIKVFK